MFCRLYQFAIEKELDNFGGVRRPSLVRHLKTCTACRAFYQQMTRLENQLRSTPSGEFSDEQLERIQNILRQRLSETAAAQARSSSFQLHPRYRIRYALSAAAVVIAALAGLYYYIDSRRVDPMTQLIRNTMAFQNQVSVLARLPEQAFQAEMQKLTNDAHGLISFIGNCIPGIPAEQYRLDTQKGAGL